MGYLKQQVSTVVQNPMSAVAPSSRRIFYMLLYLSMVFLCANSELAEARATIGQTKPRPPAAVLPSGAQTAPGGPPSAGPPPGLLPGAAPPKAGLPPGQPPEAGQSKAERTSGIADNQTKAESDQAASSATVKTTGDKEARMARDELIIEKNIFSPDRKKWVTELPGKPDAQMAKKQLDDLVLLGTIISPQGRYAVLRTKKETAPQNGLQPYSKGDYVQGYLIKEIDEKKVTLLDESQNLIYVIFINDEKKERLAEKTAVRQESPKRETETKKTKGDEITKGEGVCSDPDGYQTYHSTDGSSYSGYFKSCHPLGGRASVTMPNGKTFSGNAQPLDDNCVQVDYDDGSYTLCFKK